MAIVPPTPNPFVALKARWVILGCGFIVGLLVVGLAILDIVGILSLSPDDPVLAPVLYISLFSCLSLGILLGARKSLRLGLLMGAWPQHLSLGRLMLLVGGVFLFSLGLLQVSYLLFSMVAPATMEATLDQNLRLSAADAASPQLYNWLLLLSWVVVAPVTEEFIFRGILLHRWAVKWGLRTSIVITSGLFGLLHFNLGLFIFGLVMALLYLQSRCLWVPILAHGLNNAIASGLEFLTNQSAADFTVNTLVEFRASGWLGVLCLLIAAPGVGRYIFCHWPRASADLPYLMNQRLN